jgi:hypothetical protein
VIEEILNLLKGSSINIFLNRVNICKYVFRNDDHIRQIKVNKAIYKTIHTDKILIPYGRVNLDIVWHVLIKEGGCNMQYPVDKYDIFWHALIYIIAAKNEMEV